MRQLRKKKEVNLWKAYIKHTGFAKQFIHKRFEFIQRFRSSMKQGQEEEEGSSTAHTPVLGLLTDGGFGML